MKEDNTILTSTKQRDQHICATAGIIKKEIQLSILICSSLNVDVQDLTN